MFEPIEVPKLEMPKSVQVAYIIAIGCGIYYMAKNHEKFIDALSGKTKEQLKVEALYRKMQGYRKVALWCGERAIKAELEYRKVVESNG